MVLLDSIVKIMSRSEEYFNPWAGAARLFAGAARPLQDKGKVYEATGWKVAYLLNPEKKIFQGLAFGQYSPNSVAVCAVNREHLAPVVGCECGFHAHRERSQAEMLLGRRRGLLLLQVEMYGTIVVHKSGVRAEEQDVHAVYLSEECKRLGCSLETEGLRNVRARWVERCAVHLEGGVALKDLRTQLGLDVNFR